MKIIVFGMKRCRVCDIQKSYIKDTFNDDDWIYVDVVKDTSNLKIASSININNLPTTVILDDMNRELYRKEGTLSADRIFHILNSKHKKGGKINKSLKIPVIDKFSKKAMLTYDPLLLNGEEIKIYKFNGEFLKEAKVVSCKCIDVDAVPFSERESYLKVGGRKDFCWIVEFIKKGVGKK